MLFALCPRNLLWSSVSSILTVSRKRSFDVLTPPFFQLGSPTIPVSRRSSFPLRLMRDHVPSLHFTGCTCLRHVFCSSSIQFCRFCSLRSTEQKVALPLSIFLVLPKKLDDMNFETVLILRSIRVWVRIIICFEKTWLIHVDPNPLQKRKRNLFPLSSPMNQFEMLSSVGNKINIPARIFTHMISF
jgi:hypothetical protein